MDFSQLAILTVVAALFGIFAKIFKQPLLVGYLFAGIGLAATGIIKDSQTLESLGKIGITLLLFLLGLEMNLKDLPSIGRVALITGTGQILITALLGFLLALFMGLGGLPSAYVAVALTFSSTIIVVKLLSEKKELVSLYGKIAIGFLLVQDLFAILILIFLASVGRGGLQIQDYFLISFKALILLVSVWALSKKILPYLFDKFASSIELLFIVSLAWALGFATFVSGSLGFSLEIGGFLAGLSLASLPENLQIASRLRPLRDFFLTIFFLFLGTKLFVGANLVQILPQAILFSLVVLVGHPLIIFALMVILGYRKRTAFLAGITAAQISEFSFILMEVGEASGHVTKSQVSLVILTGVITMTVSTYLILGAEKIYRKISRFLSVFEKEKTKEAVLTFHARLSDHIVLVGADRTGRNLVNYFKSKNTPLLVVDFNPSIFSALTADNIPVVFGDITDAEIIEAANLDKARVIISTVPSLEDNLSLLEHVGSLKDKPVVIVIAQTRKDGIKLYEAGATYTVVPEAVAGEHIRQILNLYDSDKKQLSEAGRRHFDRLIYA